MISIPSRRPSFLTPLFLVFLSALLSFTYTYAQSYFPNRDGLSWTYSNGETQTISGPRDFGGQEVMVLLHYFEGVPVSEDYLLYSEGAVYSLGTAAGGQTLSYQPPLLIYQGDTLAVGQSWQSTARVNNFEITLTSEVLGVRGVSTPAGRFNALQIRQTTITSTGAQTVLELFFVPSVGVVRFVTSDGTIIDMIEKNF